MDRFVILLLICLPVLSPLACKTTDFLVYLGEIGHLEGRTSNESRRFSFGTVTPEYRGVRLQSPVTASKRWSAILPASGGIGFTTLWQSDFDANFHNDLLVASVFPQSGRCPDQSVLSFLLFGDDGLPFPWVVRSDALSSDKFPPEPALFVRPDHAGSVKVVLTECEYKEFWPSGRDLSVLGVYEAKVGRWVKIAPADSTDYLGLARRKFGFLKTREARHTNETSNLDYGNLNAADSSHELRIAEVLRKRSECKGVRLSELTESRSNNSVNCEELGYDRLRLSNGTICYGWPIVVLDSVEERDIAGPGSLAEELLNRIKAGSFEVTVYGRTKPGRCSPGLLWAHAG